VGIDVRVPSTATLKKYGLDVALWGAIARRQKGVCAVCGVLPESKMLQIDHEHRRGYANLSDEERRSWVRGLLCPYDNHYVVGRHKTPDRLKAAAKYLELFEKRKRVR
jgi:hypothetical protein